MSTHFVKQLQKKKTYGIQSVYVMVTTYLYGNGSSEDLEIHFV